VEKKLLDVKELAEYLKIEKSTVYAWISQKKIPYIKVGRLPRFSLDRINQWLDKKSIEPHQIY
jgi:excisionase family DNA binding protein